MRRALLLIAFVACAPNFRLGERRFACDASSQCDPGQSCNEGFCGPPIPDAAVSDAPPPDAQVQPDSRPDAKPGAEICDNGIDDNNDGKIDCQDPECGASICDDHNECTDDSCLPNGACDHQNNQASCGDGCSCLGGKKRETNCGDGVDNDGDSLIDCNDTEDCPGCTGATVCCANGKCAALNLCL